jgi:hypothetical protein
MHLTYISILSITQITTIMHKATITQDIRGSPPAWGYVHQLFIFFIIFCQSPYMHRASKPTPHRTGDLRAPRQILLPRVRSQHKASLQSLALSSASSQHTVCTKLTQSHRSNYLHHLHSAQYST